MEYFASQDPRSYSFYLDLNIWFRVWEVIGILEKRAPDYKLLLHVFCLVTAYSWTAKKFAWAK